MPKRTFHASATRIYTLAFHFKSLFATFDTFTTLKWFMLFPDKSITMIKITKLSTSMQRRTMQRLAEKWLCEQNKTAWKLLAWYHPNQWTVVEAKYHKRLVNGYTTIKIKRTAYPLQHFELSTSLAAHVWFLLGKFKTLRNCDANTINIISGNNIYDINHQW